MMLLRRGACVMASTRSSVALWPVRAARVAAGGSLGLVAAAAVAAGLGLNAVRSSCAAAPAADAADGVGGGELSIHCVAADGAAGVLEMQPLEYVGGHGGILRAAGRVYKPFQGGERGAREAAFYRRVSALPRIAPACFMPGFHGTVVLRPAPPRGGGGGGGSSSNEGGAAYVVAPTAPNDGLEGPAPTPAGATGERRYIVLEDLTAPMALPCVADIKVGTATYTPDTAPEKAARERAKYPWQALLGFRVTGMHVREPASGVTRCYRRAYGLGLDADTAVYAFEAFLYDGHVVRRDVAAALLAKLRPLAAWFASQTDILIYSSSVLLLYDAGAPAGSPPVVDVRLVDFAHVWDAHGRRDEGVLYGLLEVIARLEAIAGGHGPPSEVDVPPQALTRREERALPAGRHEGSAVAAPAGAAGAPAGAPATLSRWQ